MSYDYIFFDLDGTLTDSKEGIVKSVQHALKLFHIDEQDMHKLERFIGPSLWESFEQFYQMKPEQVELAVEKYRERYREIGIFENHVYEGIETLLDNLCKKGKVLAVSTAKPEVYAKSILEKYKLNQYFRVVVGSELDGKLTKKADIIAETIKKLSLSESERDKIVMIGDRSHDIIGAKTCKVTSIGVSYGYAEPFELERAGADYIVNTVAELENLL